MTYGSHDDYEILQETCFEKEVEMMENFFFPVADWRTAGDELMIFRKISIRIYTKSVKLKFQIPYPLH